MRINLRTGACVLALVTGFSSVAEAAATTNCASPSEIGALRTASVQQTLMNAGLGCGTNATETHFWVGQFNAFQMAYLQDLRKSDAQMLSMFKRVMGNSKGDAAYNSFKTRVANQAGLRRIRAMQDFCKSAEAIFAVALPTGRPNLSDLVASINVEDEFPVEACDIRVAAGGADKLGAVQPVAALPVMRPTAP